MRIAVLTGAGMSAESGIPTFRDALTGLWARYDAQRLATPEAFADDPALVWGWYLWRAAGARRASPNPGHRGLARLEAAGHAVDVITQNVDDLHERAGSSRVIHLHGRLAASRCSGCGRSEDPDPIAGAADDGRGARVEPPRCRACGERFRPDVVWFGEPLPEAAWRAAQARIAACDLLAVIGTSALVYPAASLPLAALEAGTPVLEINPHPTGLSRRADAGWRLSASQGVARLEARLASSSGDDVHRLLAGDAER